MRVYERVLGLGGTAKRTGAATSLEGLLTLFTDPNNVVTTWAASGDREYVWSVGDVYRRSGPVFALTAARIQVFSQAQFRWTRSNGGNLGGDLFGTKALSLIEQPWPGARTTRLLGRMELDATSAGNAFVRRVHRGKGASFEDRLVMLPPECVTIILGSIEEPANPEAAADAEVVGYLYIPKAGRPLLLDRSEVAHYAPIPDPMARFRGMSWITPVLTEVQADSSSEAHKLKFFENAATPNLAIKFDPTVKIEAVREFKKLLNEEHAGAWNAYKTLFLGGGADPVVVGKDFQQLDFSKTQGKGESRLAAAAGVPPAWVGFSEGLQGSALNSGNFNATARRRFGDGTMQHLWQEAAAALDGLFAPDERPAGCVLWPDLRSVPFLRDEADTVAATEERKAATISTLFMAGFTPESCIAAVDAADMTLLVHSGLTSVQVQGGQTLTVPAAPAPGTKAPIGGAK